MIKQLLLALGVFLIVGGFVLVWDSPPEAFLRDDSQAVEEIPEADSYMTEVVSQRFSTDGTRQLQIFAPRLAFYSEPSRVLLHEPRIIGRTKRWPLQLKADQATLSDHGDVLEMRGDVIAKTQVKGEERVLRTDYLEYETTPNIASTNSAFELRTPQGILTGTGLRIELEAGRYLLKSRVRATHEPI